MSSPAIDEPALALPLTQRILVLVSVMLSSTGYVAATFSASTLLPQMQGALAATPDEIAWAITFYILATAIVTPMSGWLVTAFGRRKVIITCVIGFAIATILCGSARTLEEMVLFRVLQGAIGAPLLPLGQTVILDVFPRRQHGTVISLFGMANTAGPVIGPWAAGTLAEAYTWRWGFYMVAPFSILAGIGVMLSLPRDATGRKVTLDWIGFLSLSCAIAAAQLVLARGQKLDWYESPEIITETLIAALALYVFVAHSLTARQPFLSPRLLADRNYAIGVFMIMIFGMLNFTPMVLLPPLLQKYLNFSDTLVGVVVSWRGAGVLTGFFGAMLTTRVDPRASILFGLGMQVSSGLWLMSIDLNVPLWVLAVNAYMQGLAVGLIWAPMTTSAFWTLDPALRAEGISVFHLMRNIGSSFFISLSVAEVVRSTGANYSRLVEYVSPYNRALSMPVVVGSYVTDTLPGLAAVSREVTRQAALIGYVNAFFMYTMASAIAIPLVFLVRRRGPAGQLSRA